MDQGLVDQDLAEPAAIAASRRRNDGRDLRRVGAHPDHWYPLAWSSEVKPGQAVAVRFAGDPIVIVRPNAGPVFALEDRCAHRQVPLSEGVVSGCTLRCCYHGWTYDSTGRCVDVPYLGKGKLPNGVRSYPCQEEGGVILVFPGNPLLAETAPLPALGSVRDPAYKTRRFGREIACHFSFMHENLMDMNHQFLHRRLMGQMRPRLISRSRGADWVEAKYSFARTEGKQPLGEALIFGERRAAGAATADRDVMTIRTEYPYQTLRIHTRDAVPVMDLWIAYVPLDRAQRTNRTFGLLSVRRPRVPLVMDALWPLLVVFTEKIFREDRDIVEMEQRAHDEQGGDWNQEVFPVIQDLRALLMACGPAGEVGG
jgi:phenylpropionate dioxygenase-like ring-hydroxylating dioxygenase large terminal subunit